MWTFSLGTPPCVAGDVVLGCPKIEVLNHSWPLTNFLAGSPKDGRLRGCFGTFDFQKFEVGLRGWDCDRLNLLVIFQMGKSEMGESRWLAHSSIHGKHDLLNRGLAGCRNANFCCLVFLCFWFQSWLVVSTLKFPNSMSPIAMIAWRSLPKILYRDRFWRSCPEILHTHVWQGSCQDIPYGDLAKGPLTETSCTTRFVECLCSALTQRVISHSHLATILVCSWHIYYSILFHNVRK